MESSCLRIPKESRSNASFSKNWIHSKSTSPFSHRLSSLRSRLSFSTANSHSQLRALIMGGDSAG